jgi:hypothetical protein
MPITLAELAGIISKPPPQQFADYSGFPETVLKVRQLNDQRAAHQGQLDQAAEHARLQAASAAAAERGRGARASMRGDQANAKLQLERDRMAQGRGDKDLELFRAYQAALEQANRTGDPEAINLAQQHLRQLGYTVGGGQLAPIAPEPQAAPQPAAPAPQIGPPAALSGRPAATAGVPKRPVNTEELDKYNPRYGEDRGGPPNQGMPAPPPEAQAKPADDAMSAAAQADFVKKHPPKPQAAPQAPPAAQATPQLAPRGPLGPSPITVSKGGKQLLSLPPGGSDQGAVDSYFTPLLEAAKSPEEKRAARIAAQTARAVGSREGVEKGREAGTKAYQFELNRMKKGGAGGGAGGAAPDYGGTGMSKAEYTVAEKDNAQGRHIVDKTLQEAHVTKLADGEMAFQQMLGNLKAGTNLGNLGALKSYIKTTDDRISDPDFRLAAGTGGAWNELHQKLQYYLLLPDTTQMTPEFLAEIKATGGVGLSALRSRKAEIAKHLKSRLEHATDLSPQSRKRWGENAWAEVGAEPESESPAPTQGGSGQGSLYERLRLQGK